MPAAHLNEMEWSILEALGTTIRGFRENGIGLIALGIGIVVCRVSGISCRRAELRPSVPERPVLHAARRVAGRHAAALGQLISRILVVAFG